jgi:hypothetical protein
MNAPRTISVEIKPGEKRPGVVCKSCSIGIAFAGKVDDLPDEFCVTCERCAQTEIYRKDEIQVLQAHTRQ